MDRRKWVQIGAAVLSTVALVAMMIGPADAGGGFNCDGCVDKGDIGPNAVGASEIVNGSIGTADLGPSVARRLNMLKMNLATDGTDAAQTMGTFTVTVPAAGTLLINVAGVSYVERDAAAETETNTEVILGLCRVADSVAHASCGDPAADVQYMYFADYDDDTSTNTTSNVAFWRKFTVTAGTKTFYVNADVEGAFVFDFGGCCGGANFAAFFSPSTLPMSVVT